VSDLSLIGMIRAIGRGRAPSLNRTAVKGVVVSTVYSYDAGHETALLDENGTTVVERYDSEEEARVGHGEWVARVDAGLDEATEVGYGGWVEPGETTKLVQLSDAEVERIMAR
jgi:hypothetical protein